MTHLLVRGKPDTAAVIGYAQLDQTQDAATGELVVHPDHRRRGIGAGLATALTSLPGGGAAQVWAHGRLPGADQLAGQVGFVPARVLWRMRRSLDDTLPAASLPTGISLRPFVIGSDEQAWTAVNNRAFANHPDQGSWPADRIVERESEPWFDPAGFLLAVREDGSIAGFGWTKIHPGGPEADAVGAAVGEVYVVGIDPSAQGAGLGAALTTACLHQLRSHGLDRAVLYVDEDNAGAMSLYERLGFSRAEVDVAFFAPV